MGFEVEGLDLDIRIHFGNELTKMELNSNSFGFEMEDFYCYV